MYLRHLIAALLVLGSISHALAGSRVTVSQLLGGESGIQVIRRLSDGQLFTKNFSTLELKQVGSIKTTGNNTWRGGINWDGTRIVYQKNTEIWTCKKDGSDNKKVVSGYMPHWWRDQGTGKDYVVYCKYDSEKLYGSGGGPTLKIPVDGGSAVQIWDDQFDSGLSKDGTHLGETYGGAYIARLTDGTVFGNLPPDVQHCVGTMLPDNTYRMLYEETTTHDKIVISGTDKRVTWSFSALPTGGEIYGQASVNDPDFIIIRNKGTHWLVQISTSNYADLGVSLDTYGYVGKPYVGTVSMPTVATPSISPDGGSYSGSVQVSLSCATSGATIRYTTDGSTPTSSSTAYSGAFTLTSSKTVKAKAFKSGMNDSQTASASFTVAAPGALHIKINAGPNTVDGWESDDAYVSGGEDYISTTIVVDLSLADDPGPHDMYKSCRHYGPTFTFSQVPDGAYLVRLHNTEYGSDPDGHRQMIITIEGQTVETAFNPYAAAGAANTAVVSEYNVTVDDGNGMTITYDEGDGNDAFVSGIEIIEGATTSIGQHFMAAVRVADKTANINIAYDLRGRRVDLRNAAAGVYILHYDGKTSRLISVK